MEIHEIYGYLITNAFITGNACGARKKWWHCLLLFFFGLPFIIIYGMLFLLTYRKTPKR